MHLCVCVPVGEPQLDTFYRELAWELLGVGQRGLALLVSRARYKVAPSPQAAGERTTTKAAAAAAAAAAIAAAAAVAENVCRMASLEAGVVAAVGQIWVCQRPVPPAASFPSAAAAGFWV